MILSNPYGKSKKGSPFFARAGPRKSGVRALQNKKSYGIMWENTSQKKGAMDLQAREKIEYALEQIRKGQDEGVETLYVLMGRTMLFVANGVVRDRHAAEDVVQESFVKIVKGIHSYRAGSNGYAWVCRIVRNTALNDLRKSGGRRWQELGEFDKAAECSFEEKSEASVLVEKLMQELSEERRQMVYMKYFLDMTVRDIGKELGKSKSYVAKQIRAAEEQMKKSLR